MSSFFFFRHERQSLGSVHETLFVFSAATKFRPERFATLIENDLEMNLMPDAVLILVPEPSFGAVSKILEDDPTAVLCLDRLRPVISVRLVGFDLTGRECSSKFVRGGEVEIVPLANFIRPGVTHIFLRHRGFVEATDSYHFANPSGRHTNRFIRLSNILVGTGEVAFLAFGCLPHVRHYTERVLIDTPAAFSIVAALNELRSVFGLEVVEVENFRSYDGARELEGSEIDRSVVLISASSSGGLAHELVSQRGFKNSDIVHLLFLGKSKCDFPVICDLAHHGDDNPLGIESLPRVYSSELCVMCQEGSFLVHLQGDQFDIRGPQPEPILIRRADAPSSLSDTILRMAGTGALNIKLSPTAAARNREMHIDVDRLLGATLFRARLGYTLRRAIPAAVAHVLQVDDQSVGLTQIVVDHIENSGGKCTLITTANLDTISQTSDSPIVVVAAAIESGRCLTDISRDLRNIAPNAPQVYFVGVEKTNGSARREALKRTLVQCPHPVLHEFICVESIILPSSQKSNAWNEELTFLSLPVTKSQFDSLRPWYDERLKKLSGSNPIPDDIFLPSNSGEPLKLQEGFVFWPKSLPSKRHSQVDVFFTIASVLQQLRANGEKQGQTHALRSNWFHQTVLDPSNFVRFNDDIIQACLLRASTRGELNYRESPKESREISRTIVRIIQAHNTARGGAAPEFMLALAAGRLGLQPDDRKEIVAAGKKAGGLVETFSRIIENQ
jgi:hypothetical protein